MPSLPRAFHDAAHFILHRRRVSKVARLPKEVRDQINLMLQDGVPYATIISRLGDSGKGLNKDNLSRWRKADYQDWLAEQTWRSTVGTRPEPPEEVKQMAMLLHELDADTLKETLSHCPDKFAPTLNLIPKLVQLALEAEGSRTSS